MSELIARDEWQGATTRIHVWYPDEPMDATLPDWEHDATIAPYLEEMRADGHTLSATRYYHNPKTTGQAIVIARTW
jgi:hypothetical protein